jgi:glycosyltransferase involved in cell wall biosynthesis
MDPHNGGREASTAQIATGLAARGHVVTVLCQTGDWRQEAVAVRPLGRSGYGRADRLRRFVENVQKVIREEQFDVTCAMLAIPGADVYQPRGGTVPAQAAASLQRRTLPGRVLSQLGRKLDPSRRLQAALERAVAADLGAVCIAGSEMVAHEFSRYYSRAANVRVVFNAVDIPSVSEDQRQRWRRQNRDSLGVGPDDAVFLTIAKNFELKGVDHTIRAFAEWMRAGRNSAGARLVIVGCDSPENYQNFAATQGVGECCHFLPSQPDVFPWYAAADVCVLLSWYDACSRVVLEATRWGIPSITTTCNGAAEALAAGGGIVVESPKDTRAVIAAMDELAQPQQRQKRSQACLQIADTLSMERQINELEQIYKEIAAR